MLHARTFTSNASALGVPSVPMLKAVFLLLLACIAW